MPKSPLQVHPASAREPGASPWTLGQRIKLLLWEYVWILTCRWTPKPLNGWRIFILRLFGATLHGKPFVHQRARIQIPWNLTLYHRSCLGDRTNVYSLGPISIGGNTIVAQEAYLCTGSHDLTHPNLPLVTAPIIIGRDVFIGVRALVLPGVEIGDNAIVGAMAVVTRNVETRSVVVGNPAKPLPRKKSASVAPTTISQFP